MTQFNDAVLNRIFASLKKHPEGVTAKQVAVEMEHNETAISGRLGKLAMYGNVDRYRLPRQSQRGPHPYIYRMKQREVA